MGRLQRSRRPLQWWQTPPGTRSIQEQVPSPAPTVGRSTATSEVSDPTGNLSAAKNLSSRVRIAATDQPKRQVLNRISKGDTQNSRPRRFSRIYCLIPLVVCEIVV